MGGFALLLDLGRHLWDFLIHPAGSGIIAWFLGAVFVWSGVSKVRRPAAAALAMIDFGIVSTLLPVLGLLLGLVELALAFSLLLGFAPRVTTLVTTLILLCFTVLIARSLRQGHRFACFCFGESDGVISQTTLLRTGALTVLAILLTYATFTAARVAPLSTATLYQAIAGVALLATIVLGSSVPSLWRLNTPSGDT